MRYDKICELLLIKLTSKIIFGRFPVAVREILLESNDFKIK